MSSPRKEWMLGIPGHSDVVRLEDVLLLIRGGALRATDLVKKQGEPWRTANEISELSAIFAEVEEAARKAPAPVPAVPVAPAAATPPAPASPPPPPPAPEPRRTTTDRVPKPRGLPESTRRVSVESPAPARTERREESKSTDPSRAGTARVPSADAKRKPRLPKPPPVVKSLLEPLEAKYYSSVDLLRAASFAFDPKKLLIASAGAAPMAIAWSIGMSKSAEGAMAILLLAISTAILIFGLAFILTGLAYVTRRQLEGKEYSVAEVVSWVGGSVMTAVVYPALTILPSALAFAILWSLGLLRNNGTGMAHTLKLVYFVPMAFAFAAVAGVFLYQLASMYVPAAGAIEGVGVGAALRHVRDNMKRQWGRVAMHWLIVTVAVGVITVVCMGVAFLSIRLPEWVFGPPPDDVIGDAWGSFGPLREVYGGVAYGLGMVLPLSLLSTLGSLSYVSLRHPSTAQLSGGQEDTRGVPLVGGRTPMEATQPGDTRPAPPDATRPGNVTPVPDISDDSDEQPLVKD